MADWEAKDTQHAEFNRILSIEGEAEKLGLTNATEWVRYFEQHSEFGGRVSPVSIGKWLRNRDNEFNGVDTDEADFIRKMKVLSERNPQYASIYAKLKGYTDKAKDDDREHGITPEEYIKAGQQLVRSLREDNLKYGGNCPVCGESKLFPSETRMGTQPEYSEN